MKNIFYVLGIICTIMIVHSCTPCPECPQDEATLTTADIISEATFNTWVADWKANGQAYIDTSLTEYFTMPLIDVTEFEANKDANVVAARFVLGLDMTDTMVHIMLVGVDSLGNNVIDSRRDQYIYDVTKPCPTMCGINSLPD